MRYKADLAKLAAQDPTDPRVQLGNMSGFCDPHPSRLSRETAAQLLRNIRAAEQRVRDRREKPANS